MFEDPQKARVVRVKIEAVSLDFMSMAPSNEGPLVAARRPSDEGRDRGRHRAGTCFAPLRATSSRCHVRDAPLLRRGTRGFGWWL